MALQTTGEQPGASLRGFSSWDQSSAHLSSCGPGLTLPVPLLYIHFRPGRPRLFPIPSLQKLGEAQREKDDLVPGSSE